MGYDFDMIVIGGGAAGLTTSAISASFGAKTLLTERARLGGDCTWTGCIPSKTILKAAKVAHEIRHAGLYGLADQPLKFDFGKMMARLHKVRDDVYEDADKPEVYEAMGVEVRFGKARFVDAHTIELEGSHGTARITGRYITIAAGATALIPPLEGLGDVPYLTSETLFEISCQPARLAILGGGPVGTEMAQAFTRLGTEVTVIETDATILKKDDPELTAMLKEHLEGEGVRYLLNARATSVSLTNGLINIRIDQCGTSRVVETDSLLLATGRRPNLTGLDLEAAGVAYTNGGVTVDDRCRTTRRHIYAIGDVTGRYHFTHMSEHMGKVAASNAILKIPLRIDARHVPWATYTEPELAHVGARERDLGERGSRYRVYRFPYAKLDRAITEGTTHGLIKVFAKPFSGKILGATILGMGAGELIAEYGLAMRNGVTLRQISDTIHAYPTYGLGVRRAADQWYAQKQSPTLVRFLQAIFRYRGAIVTRDQNRIV